MTDETDIDGPVTCPVCAKELSEDEIALLGYTAHALREKHLRGMIIEMLDYVSGYDHTLEIALRRLGELENTDD